MALLPPPRDHLCPVLTVLLTERGPKITFATSCLQNGIIVVNTIPRHGADRSVVARVQFKTS